MLLSSAAIEDLRLVSFPVSGVHRVSRAESLINFSWMTQEQAESKKGNRYDVSGGGVLYCATELEGCYAETLARFRPAELVVKSLDETEAGRMNHGSMPADWRERRLHFQIECEGSLPFLDVEDPRTLAYLAKVLEQSLRELEVDRPLDVSLMRGIDRRIPRLVARWAHSQVDEDGNPVFSGIRYESKLGRYECWAIFDESPARIVSSSPILKNDEALVTVAKMFNLTMH